MNAGQSRYLELQGLRHHLRCWGPADAPPLLLLHGWMDVSASWAFVVAQLTGRWQIVAPDWRGFGLSERPAGAYYFPDYLADLDQLLDQLWPEQPVNLVGHSMGGNIACLYAGIRPERVRRLVSLEGFGAAPTKPEQAPGRYRDFFNALRQPPTLQTYPDFAALATRLQSRNKRLGDTQADFLARAWGEQQADGRVHLRGDPRHKAPHAVLYRLEEAMACWRRVTAPTLWIAGSEGWIARAMEHPDFAVRGDSFGDFRLERLADCGHMLHHDQPGACARLIDAFCSADAPA